MPYRTTPAINVLRHAGVVKAVTRGWVHDRARLTRKIALTFNTRGLVGSCGAMIVCMFRMHPPRR